MLLVGASPSQLAGLAPALKGLACTVHQASDYHAIGEALAAGPIDTLIFCGAPAGLSPRRLLPSLLDRANPATLVVALPEATESEALAEIFSGRAAPFPPTAAIFQACAEAPPPPREMLVRSYSRWRLYNPADLNVSGEVVPALILNVSRGGAMVLANAEIEPGALVSLSTRHAGADFTLAGHVRHLYTNMPVPPETLEAAPLLKALDPMLFGMTFISHSAAQAEKLCSVLAETPLSVPFSALCIPGIPRGLGPLFEEHGVSVHTAHALPPVLSETPTIVIADLATCALDEIPALRKLAKKALFIGIATQPLTESPRTEFAATLPAVFVLPFQNDTLLETLQRFFRPIHRRFPRLETSFSVVLHGADGHNYAATGVNLSLTGMAVEIDHRLPPGDAVSGRISAENAADTAGFEGKIVYCSAAGQKYRAGIHIEIDRQSVRTFIGFLSTLMQRDMQVRWRRQTDLSHRS